MAGITGQNFLVDRPRGGELTLAVKGDCFLKPLLQRGVLGRPRRVSRRAGVDAVEYGAGAAFRWSWISASNMVKG
jgi:hypothetical protein